LDEDPDDVDSTTKSEYESFSSADIEEEAGTGGGERGPSPGGDSR